MEESRKNICEESKDEEDMMKSIGTIKPDRLSSLPDTLLVSILSLLPTKEVAQTCRLSKRWRDIWAVVPSLCFDLRDCNNDFKRFQDFVTNFILKRNGSTDTHSFRILLDMPEKIGGCLDSTAFDSTELIGYVVAHNPRIFEVSYKGCHGLHIADSLFTCKTLEHVKLKLEPFRIHKLEPSVVDLPRLRTLDLARIRFHDDQLEKILSGCPVLENLRLDKCLLSPSSFSCHSVKRLELIDPNVCERRQTLTFYVPFVENLVLINSKRCMFFLKSTSKLTHAIWLEESDFGSREYGCHVLNSLSGVKDLEISSYFARFFEENKITDSPTQDGSYEVDYMDIDYESRPQSDNVDPAVLLPSQMSKCPSFDNLKSLVIRELSVCCHFARWTSIFQNCPNLEELHVMAGGELCDVEDFEYLHEDLPIAMFPFKDLRTIGIIYNEFSSSVSMLESLIKEWMKETTGVEVILIKETL